MWPYRDVGDGSITTQNLDAIVVSHEHSDHIKGVGVLSRRFDLPVYISKKTMKKTADEWVRYIHQ
ncbi:MAG: MBL fold metallo-hydrolase [Bacteroidetes bacterium]|nr:MBL fold metallo-hydrolase [Bacteroidota bacterium]